MITVPFSTPYYLGSSFEEAVPGVFDVALNGRGYMLDTAHQAFRSGINTIPLLRNQADTGDQPGEGSINPEDLWPRSQQSWHMGAGQRYLDREESNGARFWQSRGVDPWTRGKLSTLRSTSLVTASAENNLQLVVCGGMLYMAEGTNLYWYDDATSSTTRTNSNIQVGSNTVMSIATDGNYVYAALGSGSVRKTAAGAATSSKATDTLTATMVRYTKGRLMAANGQAIYNITSIDGTTNPSALYTHPNADWTWVDMAGGTNHIYMAGYSGDKSLIYRTAVKADGTALDVPVVAGELPDGEIVSGLCGYLGFLVVGTTWGFRLATQDSNGNLTFGPLVKLESPYDFSAFEPQERFVWFSWSDFDDQHTGLGRMDLSVETAPGVPAYASDLMYGSTGLPLQGQVQSIATLENIRLFTVSGAGLVREDAALGHVEDAYLDSGLIGYGIPDLKSALRLAVQHEPLEEYATVSAAIAVDNGVFETVGTSSTEGSVGPGTPFVIGQKSGKVFEVRISLHSEDVETATVLERYDLKAAPLASRGERILVPILLHETFDGDNETTLTLDPRAEYDVIRGYIGSSRPIQYQELGSSYSVFVDEINFQRSHRTNTGQWWNGTLVCQLKVLGV